MGIVFFCTGGSLWGRVFLGRVIMSIIFFRTGRLFSLRDGYNIFEVRHLVQIYFAGSKRRYHHCSTMEVHPSVN